MYFFTRGDRFAGEAQSCTFVPTERLNSLEKNTTRYAKSNRCSFLQTYFPLPRETKKDTMPCPPCSHHASSLGLAPQTRRRVPPLPLRGDSIAIYSRTMSLLVLKSEFELATATGCTVYYSYLHLVRSTKVSGKIAELTCLSSLQTVPTLKQGVSPHPTEPARSDFTHRQRAENFKKISKNRPCLRKYSFVLDSAVDCFLAAITKIHRDRETSLLS